MNAEDVLLRVVDRKQMVFRTVDVDGLVEEDHLARMIWNAVGELDLSPFYETIRSRKEVGGRPGLAPQLLISLWAYAYSRGIGAAREVSRRCKYEPAFLWLTGMEAINHHSLSDFRVEKKEELDQLFTNLLGALSAEGLISLEQVMVDGTKIKALASGKSFRRKEKLEEHLEAAQKRVDALSDPNAEDMSARQKSARERAARERRQRLKAAMKELKQLQEQKSGEKEKEETRVSMSDPEARK